MGGLFFLNFPTMPKGTSQEKRIRIVNGKPVFFKKESVASAEYLFRLALKPHIPETPSDKPIKLTIWFCFDTKKKKLWKKPKPTRPDTDNFLKLFKDCMTADKNGKNGFWLDDAQVVDERVIKTYAEKASIFVSWKEIDEIEYLERGNE
jgi:Holliday junction resolvase RusA-like endonuclease